MRQQIFFGVLTIALAVSAACDSSRDSTSNTRPDKTSLPDAHGPANAPMANANAMNSNTAAMRDNFWTEAAIGGMAEVELGKLASTKAQNAEVKKFGQMMVTDHGKANDELKALAAKKNITLPTAIDAAHQSTIQKMQGLSGADFDRAYVDDMVEDHEADVKKFESQAADKSDADASSFAAKTLPTLKKHLDAIKAIQAKMK